MFDKVYKAYKQKCKKLGINPSSKADIFGSEIEHKKNENHRNIEELSNARKVKAPILSETAKKVIENQTTSILKKRNEKPKKVDKTIAVKKPVKAKTKKLVKPKRVIMTEVQRKEAAKRASRKYYEKNRVLKPRVIKPKVEKQKRVLLTSEQKKANALQVAKDYYEENKDFINAKNKAKRALVSKKTKLSEEERKAVHREKARLHHIKMKNDPTYIARRKANAKEWVKNNKEKIAASNKKYRDETRTPEQLEEKRRKQREYRQNNIEDMRKKDRDRKQQRKDYIKNNPDAHENKKAKERERYARRKANPDEAQKLRDKWKKDYERKRAAA